MDRRIDGQPDSNIPPTGAVYKGGQTAVVIRKTNSYAVTVAQVKSVQSVRFMVTLGVGGWPGGQRGHLPGKCLPSLWKGLMCVWEAVLSRIRNIIY